VEILFWVCSTVLFWTYGAYPALMVLRGSVARSGDGAAASAADASARATPIGDTAEGALPRVTAILAVRNAAGVVRERVANLLEQDYPAELLDVIVACNGCTDGTERIAGELAATTSRVTVVTARPSEGKAGALNAGAAAARGEVLVFADARQRFEGDAVRQLVAALADPRTGGVSGRLVIGRAADSVVEGVGRYWQLETQLRLAESRTGSIVGVTGAIHAVRRELFRPLPAAVILDDMYVPLTVVRAGYRVGMAPAAVALDHPSSDGAAEYRRRVRTLVGNYELLRHMPWLLSPTRNPVFVRYVSHKLFRVLTPVFCIGLVVSGLALPGLIHRGPASVLLLAYVLGAVGMVVPSRLLALPSAFLLLHRAGLAALLRPARRASDVWVP
jgi:cellulose synthase/poly-beta-1,6-N-acetylglucosamine synthase-like glycosyltransferase